MSTTPNVSLEERVTQLQAELDARNSSKFTTKLKKIGKAVVAAFASTDAVKTEKSLFTLVLVRLLVSAGAADGTVRIVQAVLKGLGW